MPAKILKLSRSVDEPLSIYRETIRKQLALINPKRPRCLTCMTPIPKSKNKKGLRLYCSDSCNRRKHYLHFNARLILKGEQ